MLTASLDQDLLCFVDESAELLQAELVIVVGVKLAEDRVDLLLVELFGDLGKLVPGDVTVPVLIEQLEGVDGLVPSAVAAQPALVLVQETTELLHGQLAVFVVVKLGEDGPHLVVVQLLGVLGKLLARDVIIIVPKEMI